MSTNAVIRVEGSKEFELYKHWDGNSEATLEWLQVFNHEFTESRGDDIPYKMAQLIRSSAFDCERFNLDPSRDTGWGLYKRGTMGYEYLYILKKDGSVFCKKA